MTLSRSEEQALAEKGLSGANRTVGFRELFPQVR